FRLDPPHSPAGGPASLYPFAEAPPAATSSNSPYYVDEITEEFLNAETAVECFNGIHMMKDNGELYFFSKDLEALGL
ncbi:MAG: hypothetical protein LIO87_05870, partial [Eubacterium sp.]|nr:hypothetical protein [Eubacterium sp.]